MNKQTQNDTEFHDDLNNSPSDISSDGNSVNLLDQIKTSQLANASNQSYLKGLNEQQLESVQSLDGPVLVLAGAGTGKTRVLTTRIAHLLHSKKAMPWQIMAVTFTNKAAFEMKERVGSMIGNTVEGMQWLGTFHAIGAKLLRYHAELVELRPDFTILDTDDQLRLLKQLLKANNIDEKRWPARVVLGCIDGWKNRGLRPEQISESESLFFVDGKALQIYEEYQERLKILNAVDFGDLLLESLNLLQNNPDILEKYQNKIKYLMVDEYQDTNVAQYLLLRLLAQKSKNICAVGDDDQSIYSWRGAEIDNILKFEKDFENAKIIRLEENYRSTGNILAAATHLISHNSERLGKILKTNDEDGPKVRLYSVWNGEEEARLISDDIEALHSKQYNLDEIAILVRAGFQMREIEDRFVQTAIPYKVIGGPRFYERAEIRDAIAYFQITINPDNDIKFERIINKPRRKIGDRTIQTISKYARMRKISLYKAAEALKDTNEIPSQARTSLDRLLLNFDRWRKLLLDTPHAELAGIILDESGYTEMLQNDKSPDAPGRLDNLKELVNSMEEFENLAGFLEHVSLVMEAEEQTQGEKVTLMTMHAAKGLEYETVYLPGWEESLFPNQRALDEKGNSALEEERRLAYVCITRAKKNLNIIFAANRRVHALWQSSLPSRFIGELPSQNVEFMDNYGNSHQFKKGNFSSHKHNNLNNNSHNFNHYNKQKINNQFNDEHNFGDHIIENEMFDDLVSDLQLSNGDRIFHMKFGYGFIKEISGDSLTVEFEKSGTKKVLASFIEPA